MRTCSLLALALAAALPACLEVKEEGPIECHATADCSTGEVCEEHICWGNPPEGALAALISPPGERRAELVSREVLALPIAGDGWLDDVHLEEAVSYKGRLETQCTPPLVCDARTLGATIIVTRRSAFKGGPGFRDKVVVEPGHQVFELAVAPTKPGEPKYIVTVTPDGRDTPGSGSDSIAQIVPPMRTELAVMGSSSGNILPLGGLDLPRITGAITGGTGDALAGYRVVAFGRWDLREPATEVSTVDFTSSTGTFELTLARGLVGTVEIVAKPLGAQARPELHLGSIPADRDGTGKLLVLPMGVPSTEQAVEIVLDHQEASGEITRVSGARVLVTATASTNMTASARFAVEGTSDANGSVRVKLPNLEAFSGQWRLSVIPPASSPAAAVFERSFTPATVTVQRLGTRLSIVGVVAGADEKVLKDVVVTARPSMRFLWSLDAGPQAFLGAIPAASATTNDKGEFVVFVDHSFDNVQAGQLVTVWGDYDLTFEPASKLFAPTWTREDIELPRNADVSSLPVGIMQLPDSAHVRGIVFDGAGARLEGAEVKLFRVQTDLSLCSETRNEPPDCPIPALLMGRGASDDEGVVRLTLPRLPAALP